MNIDEMTAEELRLEIAKAKGWRVLHKDMEDYPTQYPDGAYWIENECGEQKSGCWSAPDLAWRGLWHNENNWPADIAAAWELVEEIERGGYFVKISTPQADTAPWNTWTVKVDLKGCGDNNPPPPGGWSFGETAPLAICRAYLKWKSA